MRTPSHATPRLTGAAPLRTGRLGAAEPQDVLGSPGSLLTLMTRLHTSLLSRPHPGEARLFLPAAWSLAAALLLAAAPARAQMHKVEAPEKVTRAIGVYEWTGDLKKPTAMRLVPVSLFISGHFEDAGTYLARPVPWVLATGNEFFVERAGEHEGTLDLEYARNVRTSLAAADDNPIGAWYGYGSFKLPAPPAPAKPLKPARELPTIAGSDDDSRPHMSRRTPPAVPAGPASSGPDGAKPPAGSTPPEDSDRPTLGRRAPADSGSTTTASTTPATSGDDYDPDRPTLRHRDDADGKKSKKNNKPQAYVSGPSDSLNDDPNRPHLGRGKKDEETGPAALSGLPAQLHQAVAVSDPATRPEHLFTRQWESQSERAETLAAAQAQARMRVTTYLAANKLTPGVPPPPGAADADNAKPAGPGSAADTDTASSYRPVLRTKASADAAKAAEAAKAPATTAKPTATAEKPATTATPKPATKAGTTPGTKPGSRAGKSAKSAPAALPTLALIDEQLSGYELSYGGLPTFLYTAQAPTAQGSTVYVTLVVQKLPSGEYQVALASVTDSQHLNRVPWMRPVDVVDPDGEHRASLLMELRAQNSRQFALYRLTGPQAEQIFVTGVIE